jgi:hypothetical protein
MMWASLAFNFSEVNAQENKVNVLPQVEVFDREIDFG